MGPIWSRQDPGGPYVGPMNFAIWDDVCAYFMRRGESRVEAEPIFLG